MDVQFPKGPTVRTVSLILFLVISQSLFGQTSFLKVAVTKFDKALLTKDTTVLKQLLHKDLSYGHSSAWVESKHDLLRNLYNGKITYTRVESKDLKWTVANDIASVRSKADLEYVLDGKPGAVTLHVLQVWRKSSGRWQLFARQSTKIEEVETKN